MKNKKFKRFEELTDKCYNNMIGFEEDAGCWPQAFELMKEIVLEERQKKPDFAPELERLDDDTDFAYDFQGWLEDCLDEIDMLGDYEMLLKMCDDLLNLFGWPEYTGSDLKFRKSSALNSLGRNREAAEYCKKWMQEEPDNIVAATAGVYALIGTKEYDAAEELVRRFIPDRSQCSDDNDIIFTAASRLYEVTGKKKEKKQVEKALDDYDKYLEKYFENLADENEWEFDEEDFTFIDEDLPFC